MDMQQALARLVARQDLSRDEMDSVMTTVMSGGATDAQIGALLVALRMKGETIDEIAGAAQVMRELATPVAVSGPHLVDLVGTGGDGANLFNVSTAATFVVVARSINSVGMGFMFAPAHHSAMRHSVGPRRELGMRTIFNVLGPLTNPAGVKRQLVGVFDPALCEPLAEVLKVLGSEHVLVVHGEGGLDEITISGSTEVAELVRGTVSSYRIAPEDFGLERQDLDGLSVGSASESAALIRAALGRDDSELARKAAAMIALNAGATIYVSGLAATIADGVALADDLIATGQAMEKLKEFVSFTQMMSSGGHD